MKDLHCSYEFKEELIEELLQAFYNQRSLTNAKQKAFCDGLDKQDMLLDQLFICEPQEFLDEDEEKVK